MILAFIYIPLRLLVTFLQCEIVNDISFYLYSPAIACNTNEICLNFIRTYLSSPEIAYNTLAMCVNDIMF